MSEDKAMLNLQKQVLEMQNRMEMQKKTMQAQAKLLASNQSPGVLPSELASDAQILRNIKVSEWH